MPAGDLQNPDVPYQFEKRAGAATNVQMAVILPSPSVDVVVHDMQRSADVPRSQFYNVRMTVLAFTGSPLWEASNMSKTKYPRDSEFPNARINQTRFT